MKYLLILFTILLSGCATNYLDKLPNGEFESFEYHRAGNVTSADIVAVDAVRDGDGVRIGELIIKTDYGPFFNANVRIKGYKRFSEEDRGF